MLLVFINAVILIMDIFESRLEKKYNEHKVQLKNCFSADLTVV